GFGEKLSTLDSTAGDFGSFRHSGLLVLGSVSRRDLLRRAHTTGRDPDVTAVVEENVFPVRNVQSLGVDTSDIADEAEPALGGDNADSTLGDRENGDVLDFDLGFSEFRWGLGEKSGSPH